MKQGQKFIFKIITKSDQRGQAVVEYVLMLVIVLSLVLGVKKAFGKLDQFFQSYVGDYVACLMEYGELPSLGSTNTDLNLHSPKGGTGKLCDSKFQSFTFEDGFAAVGGSGGGGTGGTGGTGNGKNGNGRANSANGSNNGNKNSSSNASNSSTDGSNGADGAGSGGRGRRGSARNPYQDGRISNSSSYGSTDTNGDGGGDGKTRYIEDNSEDAARRRGRNRAALRNFYRVEYSHSRYKAITGYEKEELEKNLPKKPRQPETTVVQVDDGGSRIGPMKKVFTPPERKPAADDSSQDSGFTFGNFFKWLVIGGIIIACLVFFGGQILNYTNSQDG